MINLEVVMYSSDGYQGGYTIDYGSNEISKAPHNRVVLLNIKLTTHGRGVGSKKKVRGCTDNLYYNAF